MSLVDLSAEAGSGGRRLEAGANGNGAGAEGNKFGQCCKGWSEKCQTHPLFYPVDNTTHIDITKHKVIEGARVCQSHLPRVKQLLQRVKIRRLVLPMWVTAPTALWFSARIASDLGVRVWIAYPQNHPKDTTKATVKSCYNNTAWFCESLVRTLAFSPHWEFLIFVLSSTVFLQTC